MKKETVNTFLKGMIKDLHPLTTPNDVLTDALNGTLITYNGNEGILQNDMGNVKIKNALLKSGYVPVGMKEHGGIIYVAAYNPETGKGLVGSFPSPKLLWEGEEWNINKPDNILTTVNIPTDTIYENNFIVNENIKQSIFTSANGEARIFHPGDKYIIGFPKKSDLEDSVNAGYIDIQLGVIKSDGSIEIIKTWSKDTDGDFLYDEPHMPNDISSYLIDSSKVLVFDASSSGEMLLIVKLNTLDSFNLLRSYSITNDKIKVTFTGEATKDNEILSSLETNGFLKLATGNNNVDLSTIEVTEGSDPPPAMIYPNVPFGIVRRMGHPIYVNFNKIRRNLDDFGEWRFFVTDTYVKIGWAYDFYNLDGSKKIEYIRMYFHKLEDGYTSTNKEKLPHIDFLRESYNGNFEDYINYKDIGLLYRRIYIVEIVKKLNDDPEKIIDFKMLYLSKLYNSLYNGFYTNNAIGLAGEEATAMDRQALQYSCVPAQSVSLTLSPSLTTELLDSNTLITCPGNTSGTPNYSVPTADVKSNMYIVLSSTLDLTNPDAYLYVTKVTNEYSNLFKLVGELEDMKEEYIGVPKPGLVHDLLETYSVSSILINRNEKTWLSSSSLKLFPSITEPSHSNDYVMERVNKDYVSDAYPSVSNNILTLSNIKFRDDRFILSFISDVKSTPYESKGLKPLYSNYYTLEKRNSVSPYWNKEEALCISGAGNDDDNTIHYNSKIMQAGYIVEGPDAGGGCNDGGLFTASNYMNRPMTNIFAGDHGEYAELEFTNLKRNADVAAGMDGFPSSDGENGGHRLVYQGDDFLIACWKFTDGDARFVNLATRRSAPAKSSVTWPRLDVMLKCILSLIFIVNRVLKKFDYVTPDEKFYQYQQGTTKVRITLSLNTEGLSAITDDIMVSEEDERALSWHFSNKWKNGEFNISDGELTDGNTYTVTNLIPTINLNNPNITEAIEFEIPNLYDLDILLGYHLGISYNASEISDPGLDVKGIYKLDMAQTIYNSSVCVNKGGDGMHPTPAAGPDGTFEWTDTPKCVQLTSSNKDLIIHRWNNSSSLVTFPNFFDTFTTKANELEWNDIPENEENEVYAKVTSIRAHGEWTNAVDDSAPDMYYTVLYSGDISAFLNTSSGPHIIT